MRFLRSVVFFVSALSPVVAIAQARPIDSETNTISAEAERIDRATRLELAERLVAAKESPGREIEPRLRSRLIAALAEESVQKLRERLESGITAMIFSPSVLDLAYNRFGSPCRVIDTRLPGANSGILNAGFPRSFKVAGSTGFDAQGGQIGGCSVPVGATAVMINFVAVNPAGAGNLRGSAYPSAVPATGSIINYQLLSPNLNIANGVAFPICDPVTALDCDYDIKIEPNGAAVHLVADVLGYFKEQVRSFVMQDDSSTTTTLTGTSCTNFSDLSVTVAAPVTGKVWVHGTVKVNILHNVGEAGNGRIFLSTSPSSCLGSGAYTSDSNYTYVAPLPSGAYLIDVPLDKVFSILGGGELRFYVNGDKFPSTYGDTVQFYFGTLTAQFLPD